jgi:Fe-S-cluster-containing hydrogenase component 2
MASKWQMTAEPAKCQSCNMCQLLCSLKHEKAFSPAKARVKVSQKINPGGALEITVSFTEDCDNCGLCARYCVYGALSREKAESAT